MTNPPLAHFATAHSTRPTFPPPGSDVARGRTETAGPARFGRIRRRSPLAVTGVVAALLAPWPPGDASAATPVPVRTVLDTTRIDQPHTVALPDGRLLVGWTNGSHDGDSTAALVRPAGGVLGAKPQGIRRGYSSDLIQFLGGGPDAQPVLTYLQDAEQRLPFQVLFEGDRFGSQFGLLSSGSGRGRFPSYARCPDRSTVFTYQETDDRNPAAPVFSSFATVADSAGVLSGGKIYAATASKDAFQSPTVTCDRTEFPLFSTANDRDAGGNGYGERLLVLPLRGGNPALLDRELVPSTYASAPTARVAPDGRVWIVWTESIVGDDKTYVATRAPGAAGPAGPATLLDANGAHASVFFGAGGTTHVLLRQKVAGGNVRYVLRTAKPGDGAFGAEEELLPAAPGQIARVLTDHPDGLPRLLSAVQAATGVRNYELRGIPQAGTTEPPTPTGYAGKGSVSSSYLPSGDLVIVGQEPVAVSRDELREGGLDTGAPPTLTDIAVPGIAAPGEPISLSVDARDGLGLSEFTWTVDGQTHAEQRTTHTFSAPGAYVATARAVDRAGNATEVSRTIRVLDPGAVTPGTQAFRDAVAAAGGTTDRVAPVIAGASAARGRKGKSASTVTVRFSPNEPVAVDIELVGTLRRGGQKAELVLRSGRMPKAAAGAAARTALKAPARLLPLVGNTLTVRITATDLAGNRTVRSVAVARAKR